MNDNLYCAVRTWLRGKVVMKKQIFALCDDSEENARMIADYAHQHDLSEIAYNQNIFIEYPYDGMVLAKQFKRNAPKTFVEFIVSVVPKVYDEIEFPF